VPLDRLPRSHSERDRSAAIFRRRPGVEAEHLAPACYRAMVMPAFKRT